MKRGFWLLVTVMVASGFITSPSAAQVVYDLSTWNGDIRIMGDDENDRSGSSVSSGDINGDGIGDILIGAYQADPAGGSGAGEAYVIYGSPSFGANHVIDLHSVAADITIYGDDAYDHCGYSVSSGDINGDGVDDIIVGAHGSEPAGGGDAGEVCVLYGSSTFPPNHIIDLNTVSADITVYGDDVLDLCGESVSSGDVNDDGIDDIIIGAPGSTPASMAGKTYVIYGSTSFPVHHIIDLNSASADVTVYGAEGGDRLGSSVSSGDVNGDEIDDIIMGTPRPGLPWQPRQAGEVHVLYGSASFPANHTIRLDSGSTDITVRSCETDDSFGNSVSSGDVNGDGIDDIIIGACKADPAGVQDAGEAYVMYGSASFRPGYTIELDSGSADITVLGDEPGGYLGHSVWSGDINGDGIDDILTGAYGVDTESGDDAGASLVIYGSALFPAHHTIHLDSASPDVIVYGGDEQDRSGWAVCSGDVNGDGPDDILIGAYSADPVGRVGAGETYAIYGVSEVSVQEHEGQQPTRFALFQNHPNPFNPTTSIQYSVVSDQSPPRVTLKIYNLLGQEVRTLVDEVQEPGHYAVAWNGRDENGRQVASGVYFYRLSALDCMDTKRMVLVK